MSSATSITCGKIQATVGDSIEKTECVPFMSEYTDCTEANVCSGCSRCTCTADGTWSCKIVHDCPSNGDDELFDEDTITNAYEVLFNELKSVDSAATPSNKDEGSRLLGAEKYLDVEELGDYRLRPIRSLNQRSLSDNVNGSVKFYHTVDELNEDTLHNTNDSGTIVAKTVNGVKIPKISRRTSPINSENITGISDLHIDFNQPREYDHHIVDNKIDSTAHSEHNLMNRENIKEIIGNFSQASKDKDLSKLVVNELKRGSEVIGDKLATPVSNITFTPENDTLTAMAFIAGNLLSKLWQIEKDSSHESIETEMLKHEKISDLLELFKEPLTMRQEVFIKNALERLSKAINKDSKIKNISLCEALVPTEANNTSNENLSRTDNKCKGKILEKNKTTNAKKENSTIQAITKINSVLNLINKYENIQKHLHLLRSSILSSSDRDQNSKENVDMNLSDNENKSLNVFGNLLEKITKLILPKKSKKAKSLTTQIRHLNLFGNSKDIQDELKNIIGIDGDNVTLTTKDKLVIDYLNIFKTNPSCAMKETLQNKANSFPNISGNVLDNITKLLKIKSLNDLAELMPNTSKQSFEHQSLLHAKEKSHTTEPIYIKSNKTEEDLLLKNAKDKLRNHLNAILDDLVELQNYNGFPNKANNKSIANILPCIYSLFNSDNNSNEISPSKESSFKKVIDMFDSLKTSLKYGQVSRRSDFDQEETPQSSKVWERIIKNLNSRSARRSHVDGVPKSFQKLREMFDSVDISSNSYKDYLSLSRVPAASHLILLKVVQASVNQITSTLEKINLYMGSAVDLSKGEEFEIQRFLDNAAYSIDLNNKILEKLKTFKTKMDFEDSNNLKLDKFSVNKEFMQMPESDILQNPLQKIQAEKILSTVSGNVDELLHKIRSQNFGHSDSKNEMKPLSNYNKNMKNLEVVNHPESFKLTRDQVLNQLIKNRLQLYLQMKEVKIPNLNQDENYNLARRIMVRLENGNYSLAKELFKAFVANSESENLYRTLNNFEVSSLRNTEVMNTPVPDIIQRSRVKLEDYQEDNLLKQLVNLQTMNG